MVTLPYFSLGHPVDHGAWFHKHDFSNTPTEKNLELSGTLNCLRNAI